MDGEAGGTLGAYSVGIKAGCLMSHRHSVEGQQVWMIGPRQVRWCKGCGEIVMVKEQPEVGDDNQEAVQALLDGQGQQGECRNEPTA